jgi:hypothetical protein
MSFEGMSKHTPAKFGRLRFSRSYRGYQRRVSIPRPKTQNSKPKTQNPNPKPQPSNSQEQTINKNTQKKMVNKPEKNVKLIRIMLSFCRMSHSSEFPSLRSASHWWWSTRRMPWG